MGHEVCRVRRALVLSDDLEDVQVRRADHFGQRAAALRRLERATVGAHHAIAQPELAAQRRGAIWRELGDDV